MFLTIGVFEGRAKEFDLSVPICWGLDAETIGNQLLAVASVDSRKSARS
jgi:hypothetical protein